MNRSEVHTDNTRKKEPQHTDSNSPVDGFARQDKADGHLHLALRERRLPAVADEAARLLHDAVEAMVRHLVHDVHGLR